MGKKTVFLLLCFIVSFSSLATEISKTKEFQDAGFKSQRAIFKLINDRLSCMRSIAFYKEQHHFPVENIEKEKVVLDAASRRAKAEGLNVDSIKSFFQVQIKAAKIIQYRYRADGLLTTNNLTVEDINKSRALLIKLGDKIIDDIAAHIKLYGTFKPDYSSEFIKIVSVNHLTGGEKVHIYNALLSIRLKK